MHEHHHHESCGHTHTKYCAHCDVVYCVACRREWGSRKYWWYINTYPYYNGQYWINGIVSDHGATVFYSDTDGIQRDSFSYSSADLPEGKTFTVHDHN